MITGPVTRRSLGVAFGGAKKNRPAGAGRPKSLIRVLIQGSYKGLDTFFVDLDSNGFSAELRIFVFDLS
jgi:hypothetical protein